MKKDKKNTKTYRIPKYSTGGQVALELAPLATSLISNKLNTGEVPTDGGNMLNYGGQGAAFGAQIGSVIPGVGTGIGAGVGAIAGAGYGLYSANKQQKAKRKADNINTANQQYSDVYGAQNPDVYQAPVYKKGGKIKSKYKEGGDIKNGNKLPHDATIGDYASLGSTLMLPLSSAASAAFNVGELAYNLYNQPSSAASDAFALSSKIPSLGNKPFMKLANVVDSGLDAPGSLKALGNMMYMASKYKSEMGSGPKYAHGGQIPANMIEVEKGEIVADGDNITHIGKVPHSEGGDKLPVYNKGFKRNKDKPYAIAGGMVYSTQYSEEERNNIASNMKKVKFPISKGSKDRAQKTLDHMASLEGSPDVQFAEGGTIPVYYGKGGLNRRLGAKYANGGGIMRSPMNTADTRYKNQEAVEQSPYLANKYQPGPAATGMLPITSLQRATQEPINVNAPSNINGPVAVPITNNNKQIALDPAFGFSGQIKASPEFQDMQTNKRYEETSSEYYGVPANPFTPHTEDDGTYTAQEYFAEEPHVTPGMFKFRNIKPGFPPQPTNTSESQTATTKQSPVTDPLDWYDPNTSDNPTFNIPANNTPTTGQSGETTTEYQNNSVGNMSKYLAPAYNMFMGATKPEYAEMGKYTPNLLTNPERALMPNRLRDSRAAYSSTKNSLVGNMTAGQRNASMLMAGNNYNRATQDIYSKFGASELDIANKNNSLINEANRSNLQVDYMNADNRLKAKSAGRAMIGEGLSQMGEIGQLDEKNDNQLAVDELRSLLYAESIPEFEKSASGKAVYNQSRRVLKPRKRSKTNNKSN